MVTIGRVEYCFCDLTATVPQNGATSDQGEKRRFGRPPITIAVGTRVTSRPPHRSVRAQFGHTACMGLSLSRGRHANLVVLCIPFFCSTRAPSILPSRPQFSISVSRRGGQRPAALDAPRA